MWRKEKEGTSGKWRKYAQREALFVLQRELLLWMWSRVSDDKGAVELESGLGQAWESNAWNKSRTASELIQLMTGKHRWFVVRGMTPFFVLKMNL